MVHWECDVDQWDEEKHQVKRKDNDIDNLRYLSAVFTVSYPSISGYRELVQAYQNRELTHPEDSLFAFSGITTVLSQVFPGGFISGLPTMFFDAALLWQSQSPMLWRIPGMKSGETPCLPSWSWIG
jgi:hypothetical protein